MKNFVSGSTQSFKVFFRILFLVSFVNLSLIPLDIRFSMAVAKPSKSQISKSVSRGVRNSQISKTNKEFIERSFPPEQVFLRSYWMKKMAAVLDQKPIKVSQFENKIIYDFKNSNKTLTVEILPTFPDIKINGKLIEFEKPITLKDYMDRLITVLGTQKEAGISFSLFPQAEAAVGIAIAIAAVVIFGGGTWLIASAVDSCKNSGIDTKNSVKETAKGIFVANNLLGCVAKIINKPINDSNNKRE